MKKKVYDGYNESEAYRMENELNKYGHKTKKIKNKDHIKLYRLS